MTFIFILCLEVIWAYKLCDWHIISIRIWTNLLFTRFYLSCNACVLCSSFPFKICTRILTQAMGWDCLQYILIFSRRSCSAHLSNCRDYLFKSKFLSLRNLWNALIKWGKKYVVKWCSNSKILHSTTRKLNYIKIILVFFFNLFAY